MTKLHMAAQTAIIFAILCLLTLVKPCEAQDNYITCRYIPTGVIQTFKGTQCPNDWHPL